MRKKTHELAKQKTLINLIHFTYSTSLISILKWVAGQNVGE